MLEGEVPGGRRLGRKEIDGSITHRPGRDVTLSAPKSVSLMAMVGGDGRIVEAHDKAVAATLGWIEANAIETRMRDPATGAMVRAGDQKMVAATLQRYLARHDGIAEGWGTAEGLRKLRAATAKTMLVVDESSLASSAQMRNLMRIATALRLPRVVLLPGCRPAGRAQSVALRLLCEREAEIESFAPRQYWTIAVELAAPDGARFPATLRRLDGAPVGEAGFATAAAEEDGAARIRRSAFAVSSVERDELRRRPRPPFNTATLQREAETRLGLGVGETMEIAQRLYEGVDLGGERAGLVTYVRTGSTVMAKTALAQARDTIRSLCGEDCLAARPRPRASRGCGRSWLRRAATSCWRHGVRGSPSTAISGSRPAATPGGRRRRRMRRCPRWLRLHT